MYVHTIIDKKYYTLYAQGMFGGLEFYGNPNHGRMHVIVQKKTQFF